MEIQNKDSVTCNAFVVLEWSCGILFCTYVGYVTVLVAAVFVISAIDCNVYCSCQ